MLFFITQYILDTAKIRQVSETAKLLRIKKLPLGGSLKKYGEEILVLFVDEGT
jgi:hypothetical protein